MKHDCDKCKHLESDECEDCSNLSDQGCSCHLSPPCGFCVGNKFEEVQE